VKKRERNVTPVDSIEPDVREVKGEAIPVTGRGGLYGCEMLRIPHCLDNGLTVNCEILATCGSTYSSYLTGSTLHLHKVKLSP
jgi:hypothetical protein